MSSERETGINIAVFEFVELFERYVRHDPASARGEFETWRNDDPVFGRLRIWASRFPKFSRRYSSVRASSDRARVSIFWGPRDQRDVLLALRDGWNRMPNDMKVGIEKRLLAGPLGYKGSSAKINRKHSARAILERATWLQQEGCLFTTKMTNRLSRLAKIVPEWTGESAAHAVDSWEMRVGSVTTDKSIGVADELRLSELIPWALEGRKGVWGKQQELDPFAGLCETRPVRMLAALRYETLNKRDVASSWSEFLQSTARRTDKPRFAALIARRLTVLPLVTIARAVTYWVESVHKLLFECDRQALEIIFDKLTDALASDPGDAKAGTERTKRDWASESLGSAAAHLCGALFGDPALALLKETQSLPAVWLTMAERLLSLSGDHRRLVSFSSHKG